MHHDSPVCLRPLTGKVGRASLFVSACQYVLLYLDGERVGDHELDVLWTKFAENRSYVTYVTYELDPALLAPGQHVLGWLGLAFNGSCSAFAADRRSYVRPPQLVSVCIMMA